MKKYLDEIHKIMEEIYKEEKNFSVLERVKKIRKESEELIASEKLKIKRIVKKN